MNAVHPSPALIDAVAQKAARIERCAARATQELQTSADFASDFTRQDAAILNIQRACELALDIGNMVGFRNLAIHEYDQINMVIVQHIIQHEMHGLSRFAGTPLQRLTAPQP